jgi:hypothetical protein
MTNVYICAEVGNINFKIGWFLVWQYCMNAFCFCYSMLLGVHSLLSDITLRQFVVFYETLINFVKRSLGFFHIELNGRSVFNKIITEFVHLIHSQFALYRLFLCPCTDGEDRLCSLMARFGSPTGGPPSFMPAAIF